MTIQLIIFLVALCAVIFFFKNFNASIYFIVIVDIFLRIVTYLKLNYLRNDAFSFLGLFPDDIPAIIDSFELGVFNEILMFIYLLVYIIFEILIIRYFVKRKF